MGFDVSVAVKPRTRIRDGKKNHQIAGFDQVSSTAVDQALAPPTT